MLAKYLTVYLLSALKFFLGPSTGLVLGLHWTATAGLTVAGMMTSVVVVSTLGESVKGWITQRFKRKRRVFTPANRRTVRVWQRFGLGGIALLTPLLLTPIGGTIVAVAFGESRQKIWLYMLLSAVTWGMLLSYGLSRFGRFWESW